MDGFLGLHVVTSEAMCWICGWFDASRNGFQRKSNTVHLPQTKPFLTAALYHGDSQANQLKVEHCHRLGCSAGGKSSND